MSSTWLMFPSDYPYTGFVVPSRRVFQPWCLPASLTRGLQPTMLLHPSMFWCFQVTAGPKKAQTERRTCSESKPRAVLRQNLRLEGPSANQHQRLAVAARRSENMILRGNRGDSQKRWGSITLRGQGEHQQPDCKKILTSAYEQACCLNDAGSMFRLVARSRRYSILGHGETTLQ